jgi:hypothetical protein
MKKQFYLTSVLLFVAGSFVINGCSKNKSSIITPTETNLLGTYKLASETAQQGSGAQINLSDSLAACEKDDVLKFNADSTYDYLDVGMVCNPAGNYSGTWYLPSSNTLLLDYFDLYTIKSFNNKTLVLISIDSSSSPAITYTLTLSKE